MKHANEALGSDQRAPWIERGKDPTVPAVILFVLLSFSCTKPEYSAVLTVTSDDYCEACTEPDALSPDGVRNDGDYHERFNLKVGIDGITGTETLDSKLQEYEDIEFMWTIQYQFSACRTYEVDSGELHWESTAGYSGDFNMRWVLSGGSGGTIWSDSEPVNLLMGDSITMTKVFEGIAIPGNDLTEILSLTFSVFLELEAGQECSNDPSEDLTIDNSASVQPVLIYNCPCDGLQSKWIYPDGLTWNSALSQIEWINYYDWSPCGKGADELTESSGPYSEIVTITSLSDGSVQTKECGPGPSIALSSGLSGLRVCTLDLNPGDYEVQIQLTNLDPNAECNESIANTATIEITK